LLINSCTANVPRQPSLNEIAGDEVEDDMEAEEEARKEERAKRKKKGERTVHR
jgi:hypothetical protein